ncbi:NEQ145 [Nanoarchaeum equitans Kin4-M]|uniref:NEQ145 n=1 Tax=Nanoarchaeum equitans (strain Kin4-M) TaxID=228908 RepID=Q74NB2_NANEQ|nr:NEQ145 [Nanoarchaeum equitans Kin4-M]
MPEYVLRVNDLLLQDLLSNYQIDHYKLKDGRIAKPYGLFMITSDNEKDIVLLPTQEIVDYISIKTPNKDPYLEHIRDMQSKYIGKSIAKYLANILFDYLGIIGTYYIIDSHMPKTNFGYPLDNIISEALFVGYVALLDSLLEKYRGKDISFKEKFKELFPPYLVWSLTIGPALGMVTSKIKDPIMEYAANVSKLYILRQYFKAYRKLKEKFPLSKSF